MSDVLQRDADSVRYIVLRKLASGMRHALMGELQTVEFFAEFANRLIDKDAEQAKLRDCIEKIPAATQAAARTSHSMIEWLRPDEEATAPVGDTVRQCMKLAGDDWGLRGIVATADIPGEASEMKLAKAAARELIVASLLTMTDARPGPMDIEIVARRDRDELELRFVGRRSERVATFTPSTVYHTLTWQDLGVLASDHGVACSFDDNALSLRFPVAVTSVEAGDSDH